MLIAIFKNLGKLNSLAFVDTLIFLDQYEEREDVDHDDPYRWPVIHHLARYQYFPWVRHVFITLLQAVEISGVQIEAFKAEMTSEVLFDRVRFSWWECQPSDTLHVTRFKSLTSLSLKLDSRHSSILHDYPLDLAGYIFPHVTDVNVHILEGDYPASDEKATSFLQALKQIGNISRLSIVNLHSDSHEFHRILRRLKLVKVLKLECIDLNDLVDHDGCQAWVTSLEHISKLQRLEHLHVLHPQSNVISENIDFLKPFESEEIMDELHEWQGPEDPFECMPDEDLYQRTFTNWTFCFKCGESTTYEGSLRWQEIERRGYFVCLQGKDAIKQYLPKFINEVHVVPEGRSSHADSDS